MSFFSTLTLSSNGGKYRFFVSEYSIRIFRVIALRKPRMRARSTSVYARACFSKTY